VFLNAGYNGRGALMGALSGRVMTGLLLGPAHTDAAYAEYADLIRRARAPRH
jgi:glycine/D-amino acid oxidase-like deaminating enzyme